MRYALGNKTEIDTKMGKGAHDKMVRILQQNENTQPNTYEDKYDPGKLFFCIETDKGATLQFKIVGQKFMVCSVEFVKIVE